jgi:hypothetical protein
MVDLTVRVKGASSRVRLRVDGDRVGERNLGANWYEFTVPVLLAGTATLTVDAIAPGPWNALQPVTFDWVRVTPSTERGFTTRGNRIVDPGGAPFVPMGVQPQELSTRPHGDRDAYGIRDWGASIVRLVVSPERWLSSMCAYDPSYVGVVDAAVRRVTDRGMVALLELSTSSMGRRCGVTPAMMQLGDDLSVQVWREVAFRYKSNPLVAFDLYNEPFGVSEPTWRWGGSVTSGNVTWRGAGMQQLIDVVRATGARNLVFVSGLGWAYDVRVALRELLSGYGIVLGSHVYCDSCGGALRSDIDEVVAATAADYPVVITETGWTGSGGAFQRNLVSWAATRNIGWIAFQWTPWEPSAYGLLQTWSTYEPNGNGRPIRNAMWAARGWTTPGGR